ncbi:MAG: AAA family ATPase [Blastocatellia bacterium]|nr:AAA family ATPase [Blastocatellia bacterium]
MNQALTFMILGTEPDALRELGGVLAAHKRCRLLPHSGNEAQFQAAVSHLRPSAIILAIGDSLERELTLIRQLADECPETMIIAAANDASPDLILKSLRAGAREFLRLPILMDEFEAVLARTAEFTSRRATFPQDLGRVMAVFSNKGGCGASFLASNLGFALASTGASTVLVDLNLQTGDLGFYFHLEPKFTLTNLIENLAQMDDALLTSLLTPYSRTLSLLPAPRDVDAAIGVQAGQIRDVIEMLRKRFEYVVIDLGHLFDEVTLAALDSADDILLILTMDVMSIRSAQRALTVLDRLECPREKVRVVVNRWNKKVLNLDARQIEHFLGMRVTGFVPDDFSLVVRSINMGRPLVEEHPLSAVGAQILQLAGLLAEAANNGGEEMRIQEMKVAPHRNGHAAAANGHSGALGARNGTGALAGEAKPWTSRLRSVFHRN